MKIPIKFPTQMKFPHYGEKVDFIAFLLTNLLVLATYPYLPSDIPPYTSANDGTWSSKPLILEWKASVASNLHQMVFKGVLHQLWIYSISLDLHPKVSMMWSLYNHNLKVQVYHNCSTRCHWIISSFISYESMKQNIKYHCTKWYIIELWN